MNLLQCVNGVNEFVSALTTILDLKKMTDGVLDFSEDINKLEADFVKFVPQSIEIFDVNKDFVGMAEFIYELKELRDALVKLAKTLR